MRSDLKPVFIGHICGMGRMHANQVQHIAVTPALGGANTLLPSWFYININRAFPFQIPWISLNLWDCVNATEISFLTFDQHQIRDLSLFFIYFYFFFWWESDGFFSIIISDVVYSMLKLQKISRGMREVTECLWISHGVWTQQVWRVCQLIC